MNSISTIKGKSITEVFESFALMLIFNFMKGGDKKMEEYIQKKLNSYVQLFDDIKDAVGDDGVAKAVFGEVAKDVRIMKMQQERQAREDSPASPAQVKYLRNLGAVIPEGLTRIQASQLIDSTKAVKDSSNEVLEVAAQVS